VRKARLIAGKHNLPMVGVHHMEAHALVARLTEKELQFVSMHQPPPQSKKTKIIYGTA